MNTDKIYAEAIANEYSVKSDSKVVALKKLDKNVKRPPRILALTIGVIATLLLGVGMCLAMRVIGKGDAAFVAGIVTGIAGIIGVSVNYPIYKKFLASRKATYAGDILRIAGEISAE